MADEDDPVGIDKTFRALQRTGPTLMLLASEIGAAGRGRAGDTGAFYIDPERAQECIDRLKAVTRDVVAMLSSFAFARFPPPARDEVSVNMARQASVMMDQSEAFIRAWGDQLATTVTAFERQLAAYQGVEDANRARQL